MEYFSSILPIYSVFDRILFYLIEKKIMDRVPSPIENFLLQHPEYNALEVLIPENVALCEYNNTLVHISVDECSNLDYCEEIE